MYIVLFVASIENLKNLKYHIFQKKHQFFLSFAVSQEFRLKSIDKARNYLIEEINQNELKSKNL